MDDGALKNELVTAWEYTHLHEEWVSPLAEELQGISAEEAQIKLTPESMSIWEIVRHAAVWNENIVERCLTGQKTHPAEGAWPPLPDVRSEEAWNEDKARLDRSIQSVAVFLIDQGVAGVTRGPYGLADLLCRYIHMGYHLGQITKIREVVKAGLVGPAAPLSES